MAGDMAGVTDESSETRLVLSCAGRGFAWTFMQRDAPKQPRWPNLEVLAISCTLEHKEMLIAAAPDVFFDDDHYRGYPAVLARLPVIAVEELSHLLHNGFAIQAAKPKKRKK
ncbi:hypothetical protein ABI_27180 [Asticcacaulis biprosthecium C19]|uniref:Uncharacterized protein n=1 Tax=Asticcacaulis biprosthecium C19 TaxID=715226 RepID=F4QM62_9CAUL|nr:hypothetical protein [Asticcacaulis biprosthecium]EGF91303.1 hypothetical protein ABI_27180 [Asticcacaulis biprosthecium C19]